MKTCKSCGLTDCAEYGKDHEACKFYANFNVMKHAPTYNNESLLRADIAKERVRYKIQTEALKDQHDENMKQLQDKCTHTYDGGNSAIETAGMQWDSYKMCAICGRSID